MNKIILKDRSNQSYEFNIYPNILPNFTYNGQIGGIYCFAKQNIDGKYTAIYIGKSEDFKNRINDNHHKIPEIKKHKATHIFLHIDNNEISRTNKEKNLIAYYNPTCNERLITE